MRYLFALTMPILLAKYALSFSSSSKQWIKRHVNDQYVKKSQDQNLRARSSFKLIEIQEKHKFIKPGNRVVDLGAAPGGWTLVAQRLVNEGGKKKGQVVGLDLLPIEPIDGAVLIQGDMTNADVQAAVLQALLLQKAEVVLSDMAPNLSGNKHADHVRSIQLCHEALNFAEKVLVPGGNFLCKYFQGEDDKELHERARKMFEKVKLVKPKASRAESSESYLLAVSHRRETIPKRDSQTNLTSPPEDWY